MSDLLSIGVSGLMAYRRALDTTSHNIANANTAGYTRQRVELVSVQGSGSGNGYMGAGVDTATVRRISDGLVNARLQSDASAYARLDVLAGYAARVDTLLSDNASGLSRPLQAFFDGASALAQDPASTAARQAFIGNAQSLAARFNDTQAQLDGMESELNQRLRNTVDEINGLTKSLAALNDKISLAQGQFSGQAPNDLLDQRDQLVEQLANRIGISTTTQPDGSLNIFTANGQALVLGRDATALGVAEDHYQSGRLDVVHGGGARITAQISGGAIGGLLDVRREVIDPARNQLGRLAVAVAESVNAQHAQGLDANGELGGPLFTVPTGSSYAAGGNRGTAEVQIGFKDLSQLGGSDYELRYDNGGWQLTDSRSGAVVPTTGSGTAADPLRAAGLELTLGGTPAAGDRFLLRPTASAGGQLQVAIADPAKIAAAAPLRVTAASGNSASAGAPVIKDAGDPQLLGPVTIAFTGPDTYSINGAGSYSWSAGTPITVNGWQLSLSGAPATGDRFEISRGVANSGDNGNANALAQLAQRGVLDGGRSSLGQAQSGLVSQAGVSAQQSALRRDAQAAIQAQTLNEREAISGVNLDEEAADLIRYQQAYQAAARVIQIADSLFQTLLQSVGR